MNSRRSAGSSGRMSSFSTRFSRSASSASALERPPLASTARSYSGPKRSRRCSDRRRRDQTIPAMTKMAMTIATTIHAAWFILFLLACGDQRRTTNSRTGRVQQKSLESLRWDLHQALRARLDLPAESGRQRKLPLCIEARRRQLCLVELAIGTAVLERGLRRCGHPEPHPAEADEAHQVHVGVGSCAGIV